MNQNNVKRLIVDFASTFDVNTFLSELADLTTTGTQIKQNDIATHLRLVLKDKDKFKYSLIGGYGWYAKIAPIEIKAKEDKSVTCMVAKEEL